MSSRPNVKRLAHRRSVEGLTAALGYHDWALLRDGIHVDRGISGADGIYVDRGIIVRLHAVSALAASEHPLVVEAISRALNDDALGVRLAAVAALKERGGPEVAPALTSAYLVSSASGDEATRLAALDALLADPTSTAGLVVWTLVERDGDGSLDEAEQELLSALAGAGEQPARRTADTLVDALADESPVAQERAVQGLVVLGSASLPALVQALDDSERRSQAAVVLGRCGDRRAVEAVIDLLTDRDPALRRVAAEILGELGDPRSAEALFNATNDEDPETRKAAASALDQLGSVPWWTLIAHAVSDDHDHGSHPDVSEKVFSDEEAGVLGPNAGARVNEPATFEGRRNEMVTHENETAATRLGRGLASAYLISSANGDEATRSVALDALRADSRATAASVVGALVDQEGPFEEAELALLRSMAGTGEEAAQLTVFALVDALADERPAAQERAVQGLAALGSDSVPALVAALDVEHRRPRAALALGRCGDRRAVEALIDLLTDRDPALRRVAAEILGELGDPRSAEALFNATDDEDSETRTAAASALERLGSVALLLKIAGTWRSAVEAVGGRVRLDRADGAGGGLRLMIDVPAEKQAVGVSAERDHQASNTGGSHELPTHEYAAVTGPPAKDDPDESGGWIATGDAEVRAPAKDDPDESAGWVAKGDEEVGTPAKDDRSESAGWAATGDDEGAATSAPAEAVDGSGALEAPLNSVPAAETPIPGSHWLRSLRRSRGGVAGRPRH